MTKNLLAIALLSLTLGACSQQAGDTKSAAQTGHPAEVETGVGNTSSSAGLPDGNISAGEKLASTKGKATGQSCVDCHGAEGNAPIDPSYPKLAGQYGDYLAHSLTNYRNGKREHALMSSQAKNLTDQQIADLAAYFGSRKGSLQDLHGMHHD